MTVLWKLLHAILDAIQAVRANTTAVRANTESTINLALEIELLHEDLATRVPVRAAFTLGTPRQEE